MVSMKELNRECDKEEWWEEAFLTALGLEAFERFEDIPEEVRKRCYCPDCKVFAIAFCQEMTDRAVARYDAD